MKNQKAIQLTQAGLEELQAELDELVNTKLPQAVKRVAAARAHGDLSENAEYQNAKEEQQLLEARIDEVEHILSHAKVVKQTKSSTKVGMGSTVVVQVKGKSSKTRTFQIVGEFEASPLEGKVSSDSPLGGALVGKKKGDEVKVKAPAGEVTYVIKSIK